MSKPPKIIIDVKKIFHSETGEIEDIKFDQNILSLDEYHLTKPVKGTVQLINLGEDILADVQTSTVIVLECARCTKEFSFNIELAYKQSFKLRPSEDDFPVTSDFKIDLWPSIRQEILLNIPMQPLCGKKCKIKI